MHTRVTRRACVLAIAIVAAVISGCAVHDGIPKATDRNFKFWVSFDASCVPDGVCFKHDAGDGPELRDNGDAYVHVPKPRGDKRSITWRSKEQFSMKIEVVYPYGGSIGDLPLNQWVQSTQQGNNWEITLELAHGSGTLPELAAAKYKLKAGALVGDPIIIVDR